MSEQTVLDYIANAPAQLPRKLTVERTGQSRYPFLLLLRLYRRRLNVAPTFITFSKKNVNEVKAGLEEFSIFDGAGPKLFALEGFHYNFVQGLDLPKGSHVVAETTGGELKVPPYNTRTYRDVLRVLAKQMAIGLSLRDLAKLDWSSCRSYEDFEPILRTAKLMDLSTEELGKLLAEAGSGNLLVLLKRSRFKEIYHLAERFGAGWAAGHLTNFVADLLHYRVLRTMGHDEARAAREIGVGYGRRKALEEANGMMSNDDLEAMAERLIRLDRLLQQNKELGTDLLLLNAPIRVGRP